MKMPIITILPLSINIGISSTLHCSPGMTVLHSNDLVKTYINTAWMESHLSALVKSIHLDGHYRGDRVGVYNLNHEAEQGYADVEFFNYDSEDAIKNR